MTWNVVFAILIPIHIFFHLEPWKLGKGGLYMYQYVFADTLCRLCKEQHISVLELADKIEKSPRQINRYRNGQCENISLSTLVKIAKVLNISVSDLLSQV